MNTYINNIIERLQLYIINNWDTDNIINDIDNYKIIVDNNCYFHLYHSKLKYIVNDAEIMNIVNIPQINRLYKVLKKLGG